MKRFRVITIALAALLISGCESLLPLSDGGQVMDGDGMIDLTGDVVKEEDSVEYQEDMTPRNAVRICRLKTEGTTRSVHIAAQR